MPMSSGPRALRSPADLKFKASVQFNDGSAVTSIPIEAAYNGQDLINFSADLNQLAQASLEGFSGLLDGFPIDDASLVPQGLELGTTVQLRHLVIQVAPNDTNKIRFVSIGIEKGGGPWEIGAGIAIDSLWVSFTLFDPLGVRSLSTAVYGEIAVGGGVLELSATFPDFTFSGKLKEDTDLSLSDAMAYFLRPGDSADDGFESLTVVALDFELSPSPLAYSVNLVIDGVWYVLTFGEAYVSIRGLEVSAKKPAGEGVTGQITALIEFAGVNVTITADHPLPGAGWVFTGSTGPGQAIPIGAVFNELVQLFGDFHLPSTASGLTIDDLLVSFNTDATNFSFRCGASFPMDVGTDPSETGIGGESGSARIDLAISFVQGEDFSYTKSLGGSLAIGENPRRAFDLHFLSVTQGDQGAADQTFVATYRQAESTGQDLKSFVGDISPAIAAYVPGGVVVDLDDAFFAYNKKADGTALFLLGIDLSLTATPTLSELPLVGKILSSTAKIELKDLRVLVASQVVLPELIGAIDGLLPAGVAKLPTTPALGQGVFVSAVLDFGGEAPLALSVPATGGTALPQPAPTAPVAGVTPSDNAKWYDIQKSFGPVNFKRLGFKYEDGAAWFLLDASMSFAGLILSLDGLAFGSPLSPFAPKFDLKGIGIDYSEGPVEIGGSFLRSQATDPNTKTTYDAYNGVAVIRTQALTLSALGSYADLNGHPSLFLYAVLDYPLGGPAFFFVTGLTAGFGYNRALVVPPVDQVAQFPLVTAAMAKNKAPAPSSSKDLTKVLDDLARYVPPQTGSIFFVIGIKFTSFKMVDAFALLAVAFGDLFEVDVLGLATLVAPTPVPVATATPVTPLAVIQMSLKASFIPERGFLGVSAQLTSASYLFSQKCKLTGGFAFYSWFSGAHQGDFVLSVGGYHLDYDVPLHYPQVPRLGFTWQVDEQLNIKGDCYYALTAAHLMAGGHLQLNYADSNLKAWFIAAADFLVAWKPFHYDATVHVNVGATYTFKLFGTHTINVDVRADLHLWGPDFSGKATIDLDVISFDVAFGPSRPQAPKAISWDEFKASFLPDDSAICGVALKDGLLRKNTPDQGNTPAADLDLGAVDPKSLILVVNSVIPSTAAKVRDQALGLIPVTENEAQPVALAISNGTLGPHPPVGVPISEIKIVTFGIGPMNVPVGQLTSTLAVEIARDGASTEVDFLFTPVLKDAPTGLWGEGLQPALNGPRFVEHTLAGFEIRPISPADGSATAALDQAKLQTESTSIPLPFAWDTGGRSFKIENLVDKDALNAIGQGVIDPATDAARRQILSAVGIDLGDVQLNAQTVREMTDGFLAAPVIETI